MAGILRFISNRENQINQIPILLAGNMFKTDREIFLKKETLLKEPKTEHERKNLHNYLREWILTAQK
jgi:hypothetical protein